MTGNNALHLWTECCYSAVGVDSEGDEVECLTKLGAVAVSHNLNYVYIKSPEQRNAIADFLEGWAKSIRVPIKPT